MYGAQQTKKPLSKHADFLLVNTANLRKLTQIRTRNWVGKSFDLLAGPSLVGWKVVMIIGAHGWGGGSPPAISTDWLRPAQDSWWATAARRHKSLSFACVFKPCQLKHSKEFNALNARRGKAELSRAPVFGAHAKSRASHREQDQTELSFASCCTWTNKYKSQFKHANRKDVRNAEGGWINFGLTVYIFFYSEDCAVLFYIWLFGFCSWTPANLKKHKHCVNSTNK